MGWLEELTRGAKLEAGRQEVHLRLTSSTLAALAGLAAVVVVGVYISNRDLSVTVMHLQSAVADLKVAVKALDEEHPPADLLRRMERVERTDDRLDARMDRLESFHPRGTGR